MGVVYEAFDRDRRLSVALKTLRSLGPEALYRFKTEFRALQDLRHPNIVDLGELLEVDGDWFFTMELVAGDDFLAYVRPSDCFDEQRTRAVLTQLARGLDALHGAGLIHRDLKPSNIRITCEGRVVILDFGLVAIDASRASQTVVGTAAYMAPEQAASKPIGPAADWYSVGVLLYEAMTRSLPFDGTALEILLAKQDRVPELPASLAKDLPADLVGLCERALAFDPAQRPTTAEVLAALGVAPVIARGSVASVTTPFVGRERELASLRAAFADVGPGRSVTVDIRGESGVGKSALIRQLTRELEGEHHGLIVLHGRCYEREAVPYKAFDGVVDALADHLRQLPRDDARALLPEHAALLPRVFPVFGRVEAFAALPRPRGTIQNPHELRSRVFGALHALLGRMSADQPLVVVIDDMQWTDADSLLLLADLVRPPAPALLLLLSSREARRHKPILGGDVRHIDLGPLQPDDARELAERLLRQSGADTTGAAALAGEANGHPLFVHELVRHAATNRDMPRAIRLDEAVWERVVELPELARRVLELVCIAAAPLPEETVAAAAEAEPSELVKSMAALRTAQWILGRGQPGKETVEPYHDRIRETVAERLDEAIAIARHRRVAVALEVTGVADARPELALRHFDAIGDGERAARYAALAAERATRGLAFDRAAELWRAALDLGEHDRDEQRRLQVCLGNALAASGRGQRAAECYLQAVADADPTTRMDCRRKAAEQLLISGYIERGLEVIAELLDELGTRLPPSPRHALMSLAWHRFKLRMRGLRWKERAEADIAERELIRIDTYHAVSHGLSVVDTIRGMDFQARGLLLALRSGEPVRVAIALLQEAGLRAAAGGDRIKRARKLLDEAKQVAGRADNPYLTGWHLGIEGVVHYFSGDFERARHILDDAVRVLRTVPGAQWELSSSRLFVVLTLKQLGALARLGKLAERYVRDAERRGDRFTGTSLRVLCVWPWLVRDDPAGGLRDLGETPWAPPEGGFHLQHFWRLESVAETALYEGSADRQFEAVERQLARHARSLLSRIQMIRCAELSLRGRLAVQSAATGAEPERRLRLARAMVGKLEREPGEFPQGWAAALSAAVAVQCGDTDEAIRKLRAALAIFDAHDMAWWRAAVRYRLGALVGGDEGAAFQAQAQQWLDAEGVVDAARMVEVLVPGATTP